MPYKAELSITGIQEAQQRNLQAIAAVSPRGALGRAVQWGILELHRYMVAITHVGRYPVAGGGYVGGGSLRASERVHFEASGDEATGIIDIDPTARNPRNPTPPVEYGVYEEERGGTHAFMSRTLGERGPYVESTMRNMILNELPT